jgi:aminoglycoside 2'-N-acetyltransferase I
MAMSWTIESVATEQLAPRLFDDVLSLCNEAYDEELSRYFGRIGPGVHLLGRSGPTLVSHAMWVERALYPGDGGPIRSAYVELVATPTRHRGRGFATRLMQRLALEIQDYDLGALSPAKTTLYTRLGWERWRGPLFVRGPQGVAPTPEEEVMVLRHAGTPPLDLSASLTVDWRPGEVW